MPCSISNPLNKVTIGTDTNPAYQISAALRSTCPDSAAAVTSNPFAKDITWGFEACDIPSCTIVDM